MQSKIKEWNSTVNYKG